MSALAYITVIMIWSTTPVAIKLSNDSVSPIAAACLRMAVALFCALVVLALLRRATVFTAKNVKSYFAASLGIFPNMPLVYYAAEFINSGLIAVIFGLSPFVMGLCAYFMLGEHVLTPRKCFALFLAACGLLLIFIEQIALGEGAIIGVLLMLCSNIVYSISGIWVKQINQSRMKTTDRINAFDQTIGALAFSLPGLVISWYIADGDLSFDFSATTIKAVLYLSLVGTLVGFAAFYYVLNHLSVSLISMLPMITPLLALWVGFIVLGEDISSNTIGGTGLIILGLICYEHIRLPRYFIR